MSDLGRQRESTGDRYQLLDAWRGLACLFVVLEHASVALWDWRGMAASWEGTVRHAIVTVLGWNLGTPIFFVMSGYCVAASLVSARRRGTNPLDYLGRRFWRIYPTYWAALLGFAVVVLMLDAAGLPRLHRNGMSLEIGSPIDLRISQWLGNLTLTETWRPLIGGGEALVFTRVAWSLCYQEQFYIVCVLALWLAPQRVGRTLAILTLLAGLLRVEAWDIGFLHRIDGLFPVYWHEFAVGLAVYWRLTDKEPTNVAMRRALEVFVVTVLVVACLHQCVSTIAASAFGLFLIATHGWDRDPQEVRWLGPICGIGKRSYSIYLTHLPVVALGNDLLGEWGVTGFWARMLVMLPVVTVLSVFVGWAFHSRIERRFMTAPRLPRFALGLRDQAQTSPA